VLYELLVSVTIDGKRRQPGEIVTLPQGAVETFVKRGYAKAVQPTPPPDTRPEPPKPETSKPRRKTEPEPDKP